jgi:hypothetical protein
VANETNSDSDRDHVVSRRGLVLAGGTLGLVAGCLSQQSQTDTNSVTPESATSSLTSTHTPSPSASATPTSSRETETEPFTESPEPTATETTESDTLSETKTPTETPVLNETTYDVGVPWHRYRDTYSEESLGPVFGWTMDPRFELIRSLDEWESVLDNVRIDRKADKLRDYPFVKNTQFESEYLIVSQFALSTGVYIIVNNIKIKNNRIRINVSDSGDGVANGVDFYLVFINVDKIENLKEIMLVIDYYDGGSETVSKKY